jgi:hypothetical protein
MPHLPFDYSVVRIIDIDGTVLKRRQIKEYYCEDTEPFIRSIDVVNNWFEKGDYVIFWTSRPESYRDLTIKQLDKIGFKYHELLMNKPHGFVLHWYDDKEIYAHTVNPEFGLIEE